MMPAKGQQRGRGRAVPQRQSRRGTALLAVIGVAVVAVVALVAFSILSAGSGGPKADLANVPHEGKTMGSANAPVTITEWGDFQ